MESLLFAIHLLLPCQVECVCNVCSSIVFKNLWIITNYVEVWQITAICAVNETHSDGLRILDFLEKERKNTLFFHSDWGLLLKRTYHRCIYQPMQISPPEQISHECVDFQTKMLSDHVGNFNSFARKKKFNSFLLLLQNSISFRWNDSILSTFSILWCMPWHLLQLLVCLGCSSSSISTSSTNYQWLYFDAAFK